MQAPALTQPQPTPRHPSPEAYLALEDAAEHRSEYINGVILPMAGSSTNHNRLSRNICNAIDTAFSNSDFEPFIADVKVWIPERRVYTYPDVMVVAGEPIYPEGRSDIITNPQVIIEVLSDSTQDYDRTDKFLLYRSLPSFQEYFLIDQTCIRVEQYVKTGLRQWSLREYVPEDQSIMFATVPLEIPLSTLYNKVQFA
ncbi:MAG: Uma2 family endonuclease [Synechococcales cyanobacterium RU_4_20]|nr:Uma2 family endonuclease [Synechococcales cyanobacterium RU_4_20]NJR70203.1 Uma2 family endonuclease [Synechococcales cyanobacterium CRU_2_2]